MKRLFVVSVLLTITLLSTTSSSLNAFDQVVIHAADTVFHFLKEKGENTVGKMYDALFSDDEIVPRTFLQDVNLLEVPLEEESDRESKVRERYEHEKNDADDDYTDDTDTAVYQRTQALLQELGTNYRRVQAVRRRAEAVQADYQHKRTILEGHLKDLYTRLHDAPAPADLLENSAKTNKYFIHLTLQAAPSAQGLPHDQQNIFFKTLSQNPPGRRFTDKDIEQAFHKTAGIITQESEPDEHERRIRALFPPEKQKALAEKLNTVLASVEKFYFLKEQEEALARKASHAQELEDSYKQLIEDKAVEEKNKQAFAAIKDHISVSEYGLSMASQLGTLLPLIAQQTTNPLLMRKILALAALFNGAPLLKMAAFKYTPNTLLFGPNSALGAWNSFKQTDYMKKADLLAQYTAAEGKSRLQRLAHLAPHLIPVVLSFLIYNGKIGNIKSKKKRVSLGETIEFIHRFITMFSQHRRLRKAQAWQRTLNNGTTQKADVKSKGQA